MKTLNIKEKNIQKPETEEERNRREIAKLYEILKLKSFFIADISHELRTSLSIMQCSMDILAKESDFKKENLQLFKNISTEIKRIASILTDLTLLTKNNSNSFRTYYEKLDVNKIVSGICTELQVLADKKKIKIHYKEKKLPVQMMATRGDIDKILLNLIKNSINYGIKGGSIIVDLRKTKKGIYLHVRDNGIGIPKKELPYIFERFYRTDRSKARKSKGSGLGLAICRYLVENHNGKISVNSTINKGTVFSVYFPLK